MKKLLFTLFALLWALPFVAQTNFRPLSYEEALKQAKTENKLVFIDFYTDWCGPCKKMSREVFPQKKVGDYFNAQFVCIKLNAEKEGLPQAKQFAVKAYPTFLVLDTEGNVKVRFEGAMDADAFVTKIKNELDPEMSPARIKARYESGERTPELVNAYAMQLMTGKQEKEGFRVIDDYFDSLTDAQKMAADNFFIFGRYTVELNNPRADFLANNFKRFDASVREKAQDHLLKLYHAEIVSYLSGYRFADKKYNETDYRKLKEKIVELGLDKLYPYQPLFNLIECYAKGNLNAYFELLKKERSEMEESDFELILLNTSRLFPDGSPLQKEMAKYIRTQLPTLKASTIMMMGRMLMAIEQQ